MVKITFVMMNGEKIASETGESKEVIMERFGNLRGLGFFLGSNVIIVLQNVAYIKF